MCGEGLIDKFPQVDNCCCCCKVETGSKVIAWLGVIGSFLYTVVLIMGVVALAGGTQHKDTDASDPSVNLAVRIAVAVVLLVYFVFYWVMALLLLFGLYKDEMSKVRVWLRVNIFLFFYGLIGQCFNIIVSLTSKQPAEDVVQVIFSAIVSLLVSLYMISVVKSHYYNRTQGFQSAA